VLAPDRKGESVIAWFAASADGPRLARRFVAAALVERGATLANIDTAMLLVSELVTNAWMHAGSDAAVEVAAGRGRVAIAVHDTSPDFPNVGRGETGDQPSGRGLALVDRLSADWGWGPSERTAGKVVWFEVALPRRRRRRPVRAGAASAPRRATG
jgi:anti-sigma regulatory factor (Ser/Thr protein kinase)